MKFRNISSVTMRCFYIAILLPAVLGSILQMNQLRGQENEELVLTLKKNISIDATSFNTTSANVVVILDCSIIHIDGNALKNMPNMTKFWYSHNTGVDTLPENIFYTNHRLENVYLSSNDLKDVAEGTFSMLLNMKYLDMSRNEISSLHPNLLKSSIMLTKFLVQGNEIKELPDGLFDNAALLKVVDLSYNKIKKISANLFKYNYQLETVSLQGNKIKHLDYGIEHLNVKSFHLQWNPLDFENKKVVEVLKFLHSTGIKTGVHIPHHKQNMDAQGEHTSNSTNFLLVILILVTMLLSCLVGYLIYVVKKSKRCLTMRYHNMRSLSREDLVDDDPWAETEMNGNVIMRTENQ